MSDVVRCERCKKLFGGMIQGYDGEASFVCEECLTDEEKAKREDEYLGLTTCETCHKVLKTYPQLGRWECGHKQSWRNWCNRCHENLATCFNIGGHYDGTNDVCNDCLKIYYPEATRI